MDRGMIGLGKGKDRIVWGRVGCVRWVTLRREA